MNQLSEQQLHQHVTILGWLHILGNAVLLILAAFVFVLLVGVGAITDDSVAFGILGITGTFAGSLLTLMAVPGVVAGYGLLRQEGWGRILALVIGFLGLFNFPVGTAFAVYTFWVLLQDAATGYFASHSLSA